MENSMLETYKVVADLQVLEVSAEIYSDILQDYSELSDRACFVFTTSTGFKIVEHIKLDRHLNIFVVYESSEEYVGGSVDVLRSFDMDEFESLECGYFVTSSDKAAKEFMIDMWTQTDMIE